MYKRPPLLYKFLSSKKSCFSSIYKAAQNFFPCSVVEKDPLADVFTCLKPFFHILRSFSEKWIFASFLKRFWRILTCWNWKKVLIFDSKIDFYEKASKMQRNGFSHGKKFEPLCKSTKNNDFLVKNLYKSPPLLYITVSDEVAGFCVCEKSIFPNFIT